MCSPPSFHPGLVRVGRGRLRRGVTLIELIVVVSVLLILIGLILPSVQSAREAARRMGCLTNLRQLALAGHQYHEVSGCFPMGGYFPASSILNANSGPFTFSLLPYLEQRPLYDSINFDVAPFFAANMTVHGVRLATLSCPSDPGTSAPVSLPGILYDRPREVVPMALSSYGANCGTWLLFPVANDPTRAQQLASMNGLIFENSRVRLADVADGTSETLLLGERSVLGGVGRQDRWHWWSSSIGTQFTSMWPPNPSRVVADYPHSSLSFGGGGSIHLVAASSFHPGGANFAFADGSVRFIKDTVDSWPLGAEDGTPQGVTYSRGAKLFQLGRSARLGVYQAISTRSGHEAVSGL